MSDCARRRYSTFDLAAASARRGQQKSGIRMRPYRCPDCGGLHVGETGIAIARNAQATRRRDV